MFGHHLPQFVSHPKAKEVLSKVIRSKEELQHVVDDLRSQGKTIALTNGSFDMLHPGHMLLLQQAAEHADVLIVGLNSDKSIKQYKPIKNGIPRPIMAEEFRAVSVSCVKGVDHVFIFDEPSPIDYFHIVKPDAWVRGGSYEQEYGIKMEDHPEGQVVTKYGGKCITVPMASTFSTTEILRQHLK